MQRKVCPAKHPQEHVPSKSEHAEESSCKTRNVYGNQQYWHQVKIFPILEQDVTIKL